MAEKCIYFVLQPLPGRAQPQTEAAIDAHPQVKRVGILASDDGIHWRSDVPAGWRGRVMINWEATGWAHTMTSPHAELSLLRQEFRRRVAVVTNALTVYNVPDASATVWGWPHPSVVDPKNRLWSPDQRAVCLGACDLLDWISPAWYRINNFDGGPDSHPFDWYLEAIDRWNRWMSHDVRKDRYTPCLDAAFKESFFAIPEVVTAARRVLARHHSVTVWSSFVFSEGTDREAAADAHNAHLVEALAEVLA